MQPYLTTQLVKPVELTVDYAVTSNQQELPLQTISLVYEDKFTLLRYVHQLTNHWQKPKLILQ